MKTIAQLREDARMIFKAGLTASDARAAVLKSLNLDGDALTIARQIYDLSTVRRIVVVGAGKASARMAQGVEEILGDRIADGLVIVKDGYALPTRRIKIVEAGHPIPDERGVRAAQECGRILERCAADAEVIAHVCA